MRERNSADLTVGWAIGLQEISTKRPARRLSNGLWRKAAQSAVGESEARHFGELESGGWDPLFAEKRDDLGGGDVNRDVTETDRKGCLTAFEWYIS